ncbi:MAG TPA: spore coat protein CotH, partial [Coriobacteriia bacterium]|nr:spore coat protein CotH [Coriobacteriia bacterium]
MLTLSACSGNLIGGVSAADEADVVSGVGEEGSLDYVSQIDKMKIMSVAIMADPDTWQSMLDNATAEEYIPATITINNRRVENAAIRPKGNSSLSSIARDSSTDRYSFKVKFDEYVDGQTWLGLDKLVLNGNWSDASSMKEYLSYDILELAGVATPLFAYASITVNGEPWGFYLLVEVLDKAYRVRTQNGIGEMYKPESMEIGGNGAGNFGGDMSDGGGFTMPEGITAPEGFILPEDGTAP